LDTLLRLCTFNLKESKSSATTAEEEAKHLEKLLNSFPSKHSLDEQIAKVKSETKKEQIEKIEEITYNNKSVPLKSERLKQVFKKVESHMQEINEYWEKQDALGKAFDPTI
jgi:RNA-binding signal recognition particle 68